MAAVGVHRLAPPSATRCGGLGHEFVEYVCRQSQRSIPGRSGTVELRDGAGCSDPVGRRDLDGAYVVAVVVTSPGVHIARKAARTGEQSDRVERRGDDAGWQGLDMQ